MLAEKTGFCYLYFAHNKSQVCVPCLASEREIVDMNTVYSENRQERSNPLALLVIPPLQEKQENGLLEAAMQSLVLDKKHPIALELAGTSEQRSFIVRATRQSSLDHIETLLRSQYAQLEVRPLRAHEDPFRLEGHEAVSALELRSGGAAYISQRAWREDRQEQEEVDPILGLLAALSKLPPKTRAVAQIGLFPASTEWSRNLWRKSMESPLDKERKAMERDTMIIRMNRDQVSGPVIIIFGVLFALFALVRVFIPAWLWNALVKLVTGHVSQLSSQEMLALVAVAVGMLIAGVGLFLVLEWIRGMFRQRPYDPRAVAERAGRVAYRARVRLYAIGPLTHELREERSGFWDDLRAEREQEEERRELLLRMAAVYRQFDVASGAYFVPKQISRKKAHSLLIPWQGKPGWVRDLKHSNHFLTVDTLASLWHLPDASALPELALVEHRRIRTLLMPPEVARQANGLTPVGHSEHGGYRLPFALIPQFFTLHTLIAGKSGEGKSTCMEYIAREAMKQGGLILVDPHGDLCDHVLNLVPDFRADDVVLVDLSEPSASVGINPLDATLGRGRDKAISDLLKTLAHIWSSAWGPRMENAFEMALRTLFEANKLLIMQDAQNGPRQQYTLLDVLPLLTNENFCQSILDQVEDDYLHRWWREYYKPLTLMQQRDVINPVITKVAKFESILARRIIGQGVSTLNFAQMIAERKIILLKLAKGIIGSDVAALLGATFLGLLQITLEEQGTKALDARVRFPIILDEFQVLGGVDYGALAELRKYGATFFLATQSLEYLQKLDEFLLPTVLANVKQHIIFNVAGKDAETLAPELGVEEEDILNLDMYTCYIKMPVGNRRQPTFSVQIEPPLTGNATQAESIRTRCRVRYTCSVDEVDEMLREAMLRSISLAPPPQKGGKNSPGRKDKKPPALEEPIELPGASSEERHSKNHGRKSRERAARFKEARMGNSSRPLAFMEAGNLSREELDMLELHQLNADQDHDE